MNIQIKDGTTKGDKHICRECIHSFRRVSEAGELTLCTYFSPPMRLRENVSDCSEFNQRYSTPISMMLEQAWILKTDGHKRKIGFVRFDDLNDKETKELRKLEYTYDF